MFINRVVEALESLGVEYALVGGYAVALHGAVRGTIDLDLVIQFSKKQFLALEAAMNSLGLVPRLPVNGAQVFEFRKEYIENRNLVAWSFYNPQNPAEVVDVIITHDLRNMKIKRIKSGSRVIRILSIDDLIAMKKQSGRPQDIEDIKALRELKK